MRYPYLELQADQAMFFQYVIQPLVLIVSFIPRKSIPEWAEKVEKKTKESCYESWGNYHFDWAMEEESLDWKSLSIHLLEHLKKNEKCVEMIILCNILNLAAQDRHIL